MAPSDINKAALIVVDMQEDFCPPVCEMLFLKQAEQN